MVEYDWLEKLFAGRILRDLERCHRKYDDIEQILNKVDEKYKKVLGRWEKCTDEKMEQIRIIADLQKDGRYFKQRIRKLTSALGDAIVIPDISDIVGSGELPIVKPYEMKAAGFFEGYDMLAADLEYYALPFEAWEKLLTAVWAEVKEALGRWVREISDCDDWALVMSSFVAIACKNARLDRQVAFSITWSYTHAYNTFFDTEGNAWNYEPQSNVIGDMLEDGTEPYDSRKIWFPQASQS